MKLSVMLGAVLVGASLAGLAVGDLEASASTAATGASAARPRGTIVFASDRSGNFEIYSVRGDGSRLGQLTRNGALDTAPLFSPDGRRVVFIRGADESSGGLWLMNSDGSRQRKLDRYGGGPAWSPDSRRIAYTGSGRTSANIAPLVILSVDDGRRTVIPGNNSLPAWSRNGTRLALWRAFRDRTDLAVVGSDGHGLRTVRRNVALPGGRLAWSPGGQIAFADYRGTYVVGPDGRGFRRLAAGGVGGFTWSPDGRRFAFADEKGRLHVASAAGGGVRSISPKGAGWLDSPVWSPDGRWIAVRSLPAGATYHDLLVVARDGSPSRRITSRVPYPWGSESRQPSWRPRGATAARLGRRPVAPLPSETVSPSMFRAADSGSIAELAADDRRAAIVVDFRAHCRTIEVWEPTSRHVARFQRPCGPNDAHSPREGTLGVALAGTRVAWLRTGGGNSLETIVMSATLALPSPVWLGYGAANEGQYGTFARRPVGDGTLLAFTLDQTCADYEGSQDPCPPGRKTGDVVAAAVWRVAGQGRCPNNSSPVRRCSLVAEAKGELSVLAVDAGRIAVRTETGVRLLAEDGGVLRDFALRASAAALSGSRLAVRTADAVEVYDSDSGRLTGRFEATRNVRLEDLDGDILVTALGRTVTLRRLGDGRTTTLGAGGTAHAQLEQPGLFVGGGRRVTFTPMSDVLRRLGD